MEIGAESIHVCGTSLPADTPADIVRCMWVPHIAILISLILGIADASAGPPPFAELVVRIDDRSARTLNQPWVTVEYDMGNQVQMEALDNGEDREDAIAGDHLYVGRVPLHEEGMIQIWISDGALAEAILLRKVRTEVRRGARIRLMVGGGERLGRSQSPGAAQFAGPGASRPGGPTQKSSPEGGDPARMSDRGHSHASRRPAPRRSSRQPIRVDLVPWPSQLWLWPCLVALLGLGLWKGIHETSRRPMSLARDLTDLLERKTPFQPEGPRTS